MANTDVGTTLVQAGTLAYGASDALSGGAVTVDRSPAILALRAIFDASITWHILFVNLYKASNLPSTVNYGGRGSFTSGGQVCNGRRALSPPVLSLE